jgi:3-deoxy-D-manno-octulosonate 8-phosphate phosphatase (KDO 8-P phosphatase)
MKQTKIKNQCKKIILVVTDVDGVLTDGGRYYSETGELLKKFHTRDGMGVNLLLRNGIKTVILTKENSKITKKWAKEMNITKVYSGAVKKEETIGKILHDFSVNLDDIAYIGDDVNDLKLMKKIGFSATPSDGIDQLHKISDYVCSLPGGSGAFRELADLILSSKLPQKTEWY